MTSSKYTRQLFHLKDLRTIFKVLWCVSKPERHMSVAVCPCMAGEGRLIAMLRRYWHLPGARITVQSCEHRSISQGINTLTYAW